MAGDGYTVTPADLHTHAGTLDGIAGTLGQAVAAAQQVSVGVEAYGQIAGPLFVPIVLAVSAPGLQALQQAQSAVTAVADGIRKTASHYDTTEQGNTGGFNAIQTPGNGR
ncbi:type VII secretion target [Gandjariella thermophila]|uniref:ESX-1 secretion-associated protein n=1 Tax=Gandjariella thermophila TaxID=1931992 RepID=A0A4D4J4M7_9PSEU|nr:type VII secretion target [Gandjariella thermophila]GDY30060.1 hypothetical protein GTS_16930 [Gandjariella thermophila]